MKISKFENEWLKYTLWVNFEHLYFNYTYFVCSIQNTIRKMIGMFNQGKVICIIKTNTNTIVRIKRYELIR